MDTKINGWKYEHTASKYSNYKGKMVTIKLQMENESSYNRQT